MVALQEERGGVRLTWPEKQQVSSFELRVLQDFMREVDPNPRRLKRIVNSYRVRQRMPERLL